ncbi:unnamed protein product [Camellia sinensis]
MEIQTTRFQGKSQPSKAKTNPKAIQAPKQNTKEQPIHRQRRVFGATRNPNVPPKTVAEKPDFKKPSIQVSRKQPNLTQTSLNTKSPEKNRAMLKKKEKSVCFQEQIGKIAAVGVAEGGVSSPRTPMAGLAPVAKGGVSSTPYRSAERCSTCRFDRMESSAYWISQIRLAESVGRHFVSAAFFRLALESKAEPISSLGIELKRYMAGHESLSTETEWLHVSVSYGLILHPEDDANGGTTLEDQPHIHLKEQSAEQCEI